MVEAVFLVLVLLVVAWACWQFLPHPIGVVAAAVVALLALYLLVGGVFDERGVR